jgi:hypothetical protein
VRRRGRGLPTRIRRDHRQRSAHASRRRSLERRRARLEQRRDEFRYGIAPDVSLGRVSSADIDDLDDNLDELDAAETEALEENVLDAATAARTVAELDHGIAVLGDLVELARRVRRSGEAPTRPTGR